MRVGEPSQQRGFSLIEALIALVILSVGLIGVAAMQLKALHSATTGYQHSIANLAAVDAQERLWAQLASDDVDGCASIDVETDWKAHWFGGNGLNPLRVADESATGIRRSGCEFTIVIALASREGGAESNALNHTLTYTLGLPDLAGGGR
ncbi:type IV pilus modification protein PilV [Halomonas sp. FME1]|uniref:Type IV pilus modification protein PilV n=1 Tax=Halomonas casei TaxID=2742613 RepID=A0ABR9EXA5_9GAMM|nr:MULTISPECIES: type IV pilus modification protein PilV [Halomonas]MBE0398524.1 type IV pilus modification protein PilV [Halomonas casei]PCC21530.1 type IV pilus modification protein PilV [Halomonas sp. JB37]